MLRGYLHGAWAREHFSDITYYRELDEIKKIEYLASWLRGRTIRYRIRGEHD